MVLKGAADILKRFRFVKSEVADFEGYKGACQLPELNEFMLAQGFQEIERDAFKSLPGLGTYYDITYRRRS